MAKKIALVMAFAALLASCATTRNAGKNSSSVVEKAEVKQLNLGEVAVYDFGKIKVHAYNSKDPLGDVCYAFESDTSVVILESSAFKEYVKEWANYINSLGKPLAGSIMAYHATGGSTYNAPVPYATQNALDAWKSAATNTRADNFAARFNAEIEAESPSQINLVKFGETKTIGDMKFTFLDAGDNGFSVVLPEINVIYRHSLAANSHTAVRSLADLDVQLKTMQDYQKRGYVLILTSHSMPLEQNVVAEKIEYFKKIKSIAESCKTKEDFIAQAKDAFPNYGGENNLERSGTALYQ